MSKNSSSSQLDTDQIVKKTFQEELDAQRVVLVGGEKISLTVDMEQMSKSLSEMFEKQHKEFSRNYNNPPLINLPYVEEKAQEPVIVTIKEIERVEVPTIITQIEYRTIEIPVFTEKLVTIEKPIVIKEIEFKEIYREKDFPNWYKLCFVLQTMVVCGIFLSRFIK